MGIIADIREDTEYRKFKKVLARTRELTNLDKDRTEALSMHAGRTSRRLFGAKQYSPKALIDASLNDLAVRSRLVEVRVQCSIQIDMLHDAIKSIKHYITTQYHTELAKFKTVGQRNALIDRVISEGLITEGEGQALIKLLDDLVNDIDKSSFQLRNMIEGLKLLAEGTGGTRVL